MLTNELALPYKWQQQLGDVDITIPVPKGTRGRDLKVVISKTKLSVGLKGQEPIMEGELCKDIKVEDSTWTLGLCSNSSSKFLAFYEINLFCRGSGNRPSSLGESQQHDMVGERLEAPPKNRHQENRT